MKLQAENKLCLVAFLAAIAVAPVFAQDAQPDTSLEESAVIDEAFDNYISSLRGARNALLAAEDYDAALGPAESLVDELATVQHPDLPAEGAVLAAILVELDRFDDAEARFFQVIEQIEETQGRLSTQLITPLRLLGRSYIKARLFPEAISALEQAQDISRRNEGLFNVDQSGLIDDMTTAYLAMGDTIGARDLQIQRVENAQRRFGAEDPRVIPFHNELADYYRKSRLHAKAREQYEAVLAIEETQASDEDASLLATLRNIASIDLLLGGRTGTRERIEQILESDTGGIAPVERGLSLAFLGDWAITQRKQRIAEDYYAQAWNLLAGSEEFDADEYFADPALISFSPPLSEVDKGTRRLPYSWGTVVVNFDVSEDGRVERIHSVGATPADTMEDDYATRLENAYFRPQLVDGVPVETPDVQFTHYFRFYVDPDEVEEEAEDEE